MKKVLCLFILLSVILTILPVTFVNAAEEEISDTSVDLTDIVSISAGYETSAAVRADGSLWVWGQDGYHSFGLAYGEIIPKTPNMVFRYSAKSVVCSMNSSYEYFRPSYRQPEGSIKAVLRNDNSLWMWGGNGYGALGVGSSGGATNNPNKVLDDVVSYDTSGIHSAAVTSDGTLYMWGRKECSEDTFENVGRSWDNASFDDIDVVPTKIMESVATVSLGRNFSAAIKYDDSLWIWGNNSYGQLGNGTTESSNEPVKVLDNVEKIATGFTHCLALKKDGTLWVWGSNNYGELGIGSNNVSLTPVQNDNIGNGIKDIAAGGETSAAIMNNGDLYIWGRNDNGQLGDGSSVHQSRPSRKVKGVKQVALSGSHTLAVKNDGTLWSWGSNICGQLGISNTYRSLSPVEIQLGRVNVCFGGAYMPEEKTINIPWDEASSLYQASARYNQDTSIAGIVLSEAAYHDLDYAKKVFSQFGYTIVHSGGSTYNHPAFYIGYKVIRDFDDPKVQIIMAIRGTKNDSDDGSNDITLDIRSVKDSFDGAGDSLYHEFQEAEQKILQELKRDSIYSYTSNIALTKRNTRYFITGHSLGGACAGKVGMMLVDKGWANDENVFVYTYASPTNNTDPFKDHIALRIFNVINSSDIIVPNLPGFMYNPIGFKIPAWRLGYDWMYYLSDSDPEFRSSVKSLYGEYPDDIFTPHKSHMTPSYLAALLCVLPSDEVDRVFSKARMVSVHCPVDIEVYDPDGNLCAHTDGEEVVYEKNSPVIIDIEGDEKFVQIPDEREYSIRYIGTDSGTMKIEDQIFSKESGEVEYEKVFENVALKEGKLFESDIDGKDDTANTTLFVIDEEGDNIKSVDQSGNETELAKYDLNEDDIILPTNKYVYSGSQITPDVSVENLTEGVNYRVIYNNNIETGTATMIIKGINEYRGRYTMTFTIYGNGDVDGSGEVGVIDATYIQRFNAGFTIPMSDKTMLMWGDVDADGEAGVIDATFIQRYDAGFSVAYPIGKND